MAACAVRGQKVNSIASMPVGRRGIYHGHKVLAALFLACFMVWGGGVYSFVLFVPPLTQEFHWSRAATSGLVTAFWLSAPLILLGGFAIKRVGAVPLLLGGLAIEALCVGLLPTVTGFGEMYLLRAAMGVGKVMFAVTLPYAVSRWYSRHYSLGLGVAWSGGHVGGMVLAPLTGLIIANYGWRPACLVIAAGFLIAGLIPLLFTLRFRSPREVGLGIDGDPLDQAAASSDGEPDHHAVTIEPPAGALGDLLRTPMFWVIALVTLLFYSTYGGLLTQEAAVVEGAGSSARLSSLVLGSTAAFAALGSLSFGWILDRYSIRAAGAAINVLLLAGAMSLLLVARNHSAAALVTYSACFGITIGSGELYFVAVLRRRFPNVSLAYSYSAWCFCEILALLIAGPAAGRVFDLTGNYDATLALLVGTAVCALLLSFFVWRLPGLERRAVAGLPGAGETI
jgi:MFS family permease